MSYVYIVIFNQVFENHPAHASGFPVAKTGCDIVLTVSLADRNMMVSMPSTQPLESYDYRMYHHAQSAQFIFPQET